MNRSIRVTRRPRRACPPAARTPAAIVATAVLAMLAAACGGSPSPTARGDSAQAGGATSSLLAYSRCMRSHGVPNFPDPDPSSSNTKAGSAQELGVSGSELETAENACQRLLPAGVNDRFPPAEVQLLLPRMRNFSDCMRSHGVPNFPDPTIDDQGRPVFDLSDAGFSRQQAHAPQFDALMQECDHLLPRQLGGIPLG